MKKTAKNILTLNAQEVLDFLMKSDQFHGFELPEYFDFDDVLQHVRQTVGDKKYEDCVSGKPEECEDVNVDILLNKDGKYAVRPLTLANPYLYYFLCREISQGWKAILKCFRHYQVPHLLSAALPVVPQEQESFFKSATILNWWNSMEQQSLKLSLKYRYMFVTDITNCYGSINPQSIEWALTCKDTEFEGEKNKRLAERIQLYLRALQHGHNIGIPQGSTLFDLIGEIVLGYADLRLNEALERNQIRSGYEIIRYRDDYRIFCNDRGLLEKISYILQSVLESLNFRMNSQKTKISDSIVTDSIKPDKLFYIFNTPIQRKKKQFAFDGLQKHLMYILMFSRQYPNSGQVRVMLSDLDKRIIGILRPRKKSEKWVTVDLEDHPKSVLKKLKLYKDTYEGGTILENVRVLTAIATQIALENVTVSHYALRVVSRMVDSLEDMLEKEDLIRKVYLKLCEQPNSDYNQLWLQNITYVRDSLTGACPYDVRLCQAVMGNFEEPLWNLDWLKPELKKDFPQQSVVNPVTLDRVTPVITFRETRAYYDLMAK